MTTSTENNAIIEALKKSNECQWNGTTVHDNLEKCLNGINIYLGCNSGWYNPKAIKINGLKGYYMINENGSLCFEARVIKKNEKEYNIEYLSNDGYNKLINDYNNIFNK